MPDVDGFDSTSGTLPGALLSLEVDVRLDESLNTAFAFGSCTRLDSAPVALQHWWYAALRREAPEHVLIQDQVETQSSGGLTMRCAGHSVERMEPQNPSIVHDRDLPGMISSRSSNSLLPCSNITGHQKSR